MTGKTMTIPAIANSPTAKWSYLSLIYSVFYFFALVFNWQGHSTVEIGLIFGFYGVFITLFLRCLRTQGSQAYYPVAALIGLSGLIATFYTGASALFGYGAFLSSYYFNQRQAWWFFLFNIAVQVGVCAAAESLDFYFLAPSLTITVSLFIFGRFSHKECVHKIREQEQNAHIEQLAAIAERERIARDMHDLLGHSLSSLALKSELAEKLINKGRNEEAREEIGQVADIARTTLAQVRAAVTGLNQTGLGATLNSLTEQLEHLGFSTQSFVELPAMDAKTESTLIMLCKEWITNILRHSHGDSVSISLVQNENQIRLHIGDNGQEVKIEPGNGIKGMKHRIEELDGELKLTTNDGVKLQVVLPALG